MITFVRTTREGCDDLFQAYLATLSGVYDNFLEDHILDSDCHRIQDGDRTIGLLAVHGNTMLTVFHIGLADLRLAQPAFNAALATFGLSCAFVPTCDELFLSLAMDRHVRIEKQAYFFLDSGRTMRAPEYGRASLLPVPREQWDEVNARTENFFDEVLAPKVRDGHVPYEIYELRSDDGILGYGLREGTRIFTGFDCIGMYVMPAHREKGVGRSIILHLKDICREAGQGALPGCWYYNHNSKRTLESAGFVTKTRLLKVFFE